MARTYQDKDREKYVTVLGRETVFSGTLEFSENLKITGRFDGTINARGNLVVDKGAVCRVNHIKASAIAVEGSVSGNMEAVERVELKKGSVIRGNITTSRLRIADGVLFEGDVTMLRTGTDIDVFAAPADELKSSIRQIAETAGGEAGGQQPLTHA